MLIEMTVYDGVDKMYSITRRDTGLWLENELGEGMELSDKMLFEYLNKLFKNNF